METELSDVKEQLNEKKLHLDELSKTIIKREDELTNALTKCDEEAVARAQVSSVYFAIVVVTSLSAYVSVFLPICI